MNKTKDYDMFDKVKGNREVNEPHLKRLQESILENNLLFANPIIVSGDYAVIDGQHRLEVARKNNLDIYYIIVPDKEALKVVKKLNTRVKSWSLGNFIDSNIELGIVDYQILKDFSKKYGITPSIAADLLQGKTSGYTRSHASAELKEGNFKIKGLTGAIKLADALVLVRPYVGNAWKDRAFLKALQLAFKVVGSKKMVKRLSTSPLKIVRQAGVKEYLRNLEEIYNHHLTEASRVRFF